jgi:sugar phosphate isomerase/epimerase
LAPVDGLTPEEAVAINEANQRFDGIERIEPDGIVTFCFEDVEVLRDALGYDASSLKPEEADDRAAELMAKLREFAKLSGVDLDQAWQAARLS